MQVHPLKEELGSLAALQKCQLLSFFLDVGSMREISLCLLKCTLGFWGFRWQISYGTRRAAVVCESRDNFSLEVAASKVVTCAGPNEPVSMWGRQGWLKHGWEKRKCSCGQFKDCSAETCH